MTSKLKRIVAPSFYKKLIRYSRLYGSDVIKDLIISKKFPEFPDYNKWYKQTYLESTAHKNACDFKLAYSPKISIITVFYIDKLNWLRDTIDSVLSQSYSEWELCIAYESNKSKNNDNKTPHFSEFINILKSYADKDNRIKITKANNGLGDAGNLNLALELATGDYVAFLDQNDLLPKHALYYVAYSLQKNRHDILYSDEDYITDDLQYKYKPQFKPDWSPQLLDCYNYFNHLFIINKSFLDKIGKFHNHYNGAHFYDMVLRCTEASKDIFHIQEILYHCRIKKSAWSLSDATNCSDWSVGKAALESHFNREKIDVKVENGNTLGYYHPFYPAEGSPLVSIIIPNNDHIEYLSRCVNSLYNKNEYKNFEIIIAENNSQKNETFEYYNKLISAHDNLNVVNYEDEFNFSAVNNFAVNAAKGEYLLFLNNDTELISKDAICQMLGCCMIKDVGAVGAKLLYDDNTVQHAGVVIGFGGFAGHVFNGAKKDDTCYLNLAQLSYNCSAVTGACLMTPKKLFIDLGGFNEDFKVAVNDIDYCLKVRDSGNYLVCNNYALWYHFESKSRGYDLEDPVKKQRFCDEIKLFQKLWPNAWKNNDPFYNKNFDVHYGAYQLHVQD